jgi:hypothetical protein
MSITQYLKKDFISLRDSLGSNSIGMILSVIFVRHMLSLMRPYPNTKKTPKRMVIKAMKAEKRP